MNAFAWFIWHRIHCDMLSTKGSNLKLGTFSNLYLNVHISVIEYGCTVFFFREYSKSESNTLC